MKKSRRMVTRLLSWLLVMTLVCTGIPISAGAAKKPKLNKKSVKLKVGKTVKLKVKNNKKKVKWSSANKKIATVNKKGLVKAKKKGKTRIIAKIKKKKLICKITVQANNTGNSNESAEDNGSGDSNNNSDNGSGSGGETQVTQTPSGETEKPGESPDKTPSAQKTAAPGNTSGPQITPEPVTTTSPWEIPWGTPLPGTTTAPGENTPIPGVTPEPGETSIPNPGWTPGPGTTTEPGETTPIPWWTPEPGTTTAPGENTPIPGVTSEPGTTTTPVVNPTQGPAKTSTPVPAPTTAPTKAPTTAPTKAPTATPTKAPTAAPTVTPTATPSQGGDIPSGATVFTMGSKKLAIGMTEDAVKTTLGIPSNYQKGKSPQGFDTISYHTDTYSEYLLIYLQDSKVVGICGIGKSMSYGGYVVAGQNGNNLSGWTNNNQYKTDVNKLVAAKEKKISTTEQVYAFYDAFGDNTVYCIQVFDPSNANVKIASQNDNNMIYSKTPNTYGSDVTASVATEIGHMLNAFRAYKGKSLFTLDPRLAACAQKRCKTGSSGSLLDAMLEQDLDPTAQGEADYDGAADAVSFANSLIELEDFYKVLINTKVEGKIIPEWEVIGVGMSYSSGNAHVIVDYAFEP